MESFPFHELEASSLPMIDETVYPSITKPVRSNLDLPFRKLYNIEILDSTGTLHPALDRLKFDGPFMVKGWVPIEETILRRGQTGRNLVYVLAKRIVEWTHEFNPHNIMQPIFWVNSENVCWYQVQSFSSAYTPIMAPLSDVCAYLDAIIQVIFVDKRGGDQSVVLPLAANKLRMSVEAVREKVAHYRSQLIDLCSNDTELNHLQIYKEWITEQRLQELRLAAHNAPTSFSALPEEESTARSISPPSTSLSRPHGTSTSRTSSSRSTPTRKSRPITFKTLDTQDTPEVQGDSTPVATSESTEEEMEVLETANSPDSSVLSVQLEDLHVTTSAKRPRDRWLTQPSNMDEDDQEPATEQRPSKRVPGRRPPHTNAILSSDSDSTDDISMDVGSVVAHSQSMDGDVSGADESEQEGDDMIQTSLIDPSNTTTTEPQVLAPFGQSDAPRPYFALSSTKSSSTELPKPSRVKATLMRDLVMNRFVGSSISHVTPDTFNCPWNGCLTAISNSLYPSLEKFIHAVLGHILRHDLSNEDGLLSMEAYLRLPKLQPLHGIASPTNNTMPEPKATIINMDLYWLLESGRMSSDLNQGRRYQPRSKLMGPASVVGKGMSPGPTNNTVKKYPKRLGRTEG